MIFNGWNLTCSRLYMQRCKQSILPLFHLLLPIGYILVEVSLRPVVLVIGLPVIMFGISSLIPNNLAIWGRIMYTCYCMHSEPIYERLDIWKWLMEYHVPHLCHVGLDQSVFALITNGIKNRHHYWTCWLIAFIFLLELEDPEFCLLFLSFPLQKKESSISEMDLWTLAGLAVSVG